MIFEFSPRFVSALAVDALNFVLMSLVEVDVERVARVERLIAQAAAVFVLRCLAVFYRRISVGTRGCFWYTGSKIDN